MAVTLQQVKLQNNRFHSTIQEIIYNNQSEYIINPAVRFEYDTEYSNRNKMMKDVPSVKGFEQVTFFINLNGHYLI